MTTKQRQHLREQARQAGSTARSAYFRQRVREMGGYNARTRDQINTECDAVERDAMHQVYLAAGYRECRAETCDRLVTPGFTLCPECVRLTQGGLGAAIGAPTLGEPVELHPEYIAREQRELERHEREMAEREGLYLDGFLSGYAAGYY